MTSTTAASDAAAVVEQARAEVLAARATLGEWEGKQKAATAELEGLEQLAGDLVLDDPAAALQTEERVAARQADQRIARRAVEAQRPRVLAAEARYFAAEAAALREQLTTARADLAKHVATSDQLLRKLQQHEHCPYVPEAEVIKLRRAAGDDGASAWQIPRTEVLRRAVRQIEDQLTMVEELAAGRDPAVWARANRWSVISGATVDLPAHLAGAEALVPTRSYLAQAAAARGRLEELEDLRDSLPERLEERAEEVRVHTPDVDLTDDYIWAQLRSRLDGLDAEIGQARSSLAAILGPTSVDAEAPDQEE